MHAQAEGVPFILQEVARAYRDSGMIQQIDGTWTLRRHAERLVPSAVRTLIQRRAARLPEDTRTVLAEAAVVGRTFSVRDLQAVKEQLGDPAPDAVALAELFAPAVGAGLLLEQPTTGAADYRFAHEQVQEFAAASLTLPRRRAIHLALVDLLSADGEPSTASLPLLARHALEADDTERAARYSIAAARAALAARAPEEVLRLVDRALPVVASPQDRVALLMARDDALDMLRRPDDRIEGLAELAALTDALGDPHLELETTLRRAAAMRLAGEDGRAAELAAAVRADAAGRGDRRAELHACLELGQAHLGKPLGESFSPSSTEGDLDGAEEAYTCACTLARELGDRAALAAATRELGVLGSGRVRDWFVAYKRTHGLEPVLQRIAAGEQLDDIVAELDVAPVIAGANAFFEQAIELYDEVGDRRGMMSAIIALAYLRFAPDIHLQASAKRIEEIRRLATQLVALSRESERDRAEAQMLYGVHVFARAKVVPDLAVSRGVEAYDKAHLLGDRSLAFLAAGGVAMVHLELGERAEADCWIDRAASAAAAAPTPFRARQLALWRGSCLAAGGDSAAMREQLQHAVELAEAQRRPPASCEAHAHLAFEAARLGRRTGDADLLALAADSARGAHALMPSLPGHPLWGARADAALVYVALARDDAPAAAAAARRATTALTAADVEDLHPDIRFAVGHGLLAGGSEEEREQVRAALRVGVTLIAQRILDDEVRAKWFTGPVGRELTALVGAGDPFTTQAATAAVDLDTDDIALLRLLVEGRSNRAIADALGVSESALGRRLAALYARTGSTSRAEATSFALRERVV
jgi:DNA-binding CsgD family transcriptional regulator